MRASSYNIELSNLDKVFFPEQGITKGDLINYYKRIGETMIPLMSGRPVTMHRFPDGLGKEGFFQQEMPDYFPDWIERVTVKKKEGGSISRVICNKTADLVYLANQGCITPHIWLSQKGSLNYPNRMIFDLDPADDDFKTVCQGALLLKDLLLSRELTPFVMTTGSKGLHVVVPLNGKEDFDTVREFAKKIAELAASKKPDQFTTEQRKNKRQGRLYLDVSRNAYGQTAVAPYAVRPIEGAPVATPLDWHELKKGNLTAQKYNINNLFRRLAQKKDPWKDLDKRSTSLF